MDVHSLSSVRRGVKSRPAAAMSSSRHRGAKPVLQSPPKLSRKVCRAHETAPHGRTSAVAGGGTRALRRPHASRLIAALVVSLWRLAQPPRRRAAPPPPTWPARVTDQSKACCRAPPSPSPTQNTNLSRTVVTKASGRFIRPGAAARHLHRARRAGRFRPPRLRENVVLNLGTSRRSRFRARNRRQGGERQR